MNIANQFLTDAAIIVPVFGLACLLIGIRSLRSAASPLPKQAIETSKENLEWLKTRLRSARK